MSFFLLPSSFPPFLMAAQRVFDMDDLVGCILCFVGDRQKVAVLSLVNKTCASMSQDAVSWEGGSDGFILKKPTLSRLRLLRRVQDAGHTTYIIGHPWLACCPSLVAVSGVESWVHEPIDVMRAFLQRAVSLDVWNISNLLTTVGVDGDDLSTTLVNLTDLSTTCTTAPFLTSTVVASLVRLCIPLDPDMPAILRAASVGNLRTLEMSTCGMVCTSLSLEMRDIWPRMGSLRSLVLPSGFAADLDEIARCTPLLDTLVVDICDIEDVIDEAWCASVRWPLLTSLVVSERAGNHAECVGELLRSLHPNTTLRSLDVPINYRKHDDVVRAIVRAIVERCSGSLTSLRVCFGSDASDASDKSYYCIKATSRTLLQEVGATLVDLAGIWFAFADVSRFCPRLRTFDTHSQTCLRNIADIARGCPVLDACNDDSEVYA
jgi:hypothetical protein